MFFCYWCTICVASVLWYCWLGLLTCKNRLPYNLYWVGGDVKHCSLTHCYCALALRPWVLFEAYTMFVITVVYQLNSLDFTCRYILQCESKKSPPPGDLTFFFFFHKRLIICNWFFTHLLNVPILARLQIFIQLSPILTKLCHIKRDYPVHIIYAKCPKRTKTRAFRRLRKSLIALLIVVCGKSL